MLRFFIGGGGLVGISLNGKCVFGFVLGWWLWWYVVYMVSSNFV